MMDTFIANVGPDEQVLCINVGILINISVFSLRAILRITMARGDPTVTQHFTTVARDFLQKKYISNPVVHGDLFATVGQAPVPTPSLFSVLATIRALYGIGMGFRGLTLLETVVKTTLGIQWQDEGEMTTVLAAIDADIIQAIQSSKEELIAERVEDLDKARNIVMTLTDTLKRVRNHAQTWGGEFPFEQALDGLEFWKV